MGDLILTCSQCGHEMRVSEYALGAQGRCANCDMVLVVSPENTHPLSEEPDADTSPHVQEQSSESTGSFIDASVERGKVETPSNCCKRCGRRFRGEWDRNETEDGTLCHICANLSTETTTLSRTEPHSPRKSGTPDPFAPLPLEVETQQPEQQQKPVPKWAEKNPRLFRGGVLALGLLVIALGIYFAIFGEPQSTQIEADYESGMHAMSRMPELPQWLIVIAFVFRFSLAFIVYYMVIYTVLYMAGKLYSDSLIPNLIDITPTVLLFWIISVVASLLGIIVPSCLLLPLQILMCWYILWDRHDLQFQWMLVLLILNPIIEFMAHIIMIVFLGSMSLIFG